MNEQAVGLYSAAYKIVIFFISINIAYFSVILPVVSRFYKNNLDELKEHMKKSMKLATLFAIPVGFAGTLLAKPIIHMIYGSQYTNSIMVFQFLVWVIPLIVIRSHYRVLLVGLNKQTSDLKILSLGFAINATMNIILIPMYGLLGAAIATLCSETVILIYAHRFTKHHIIGIPFIKYLVKPIFSAVIMSAVLYGIKEINLFILLLTGIFTYFGVLFLTSGITRNDIKLILQKA
jgi:O-antigen/teichoic acid export membrane protein